MGKTLHKLHLYLGLGAALVLMLVGVTGAILSYEKELLRMLHKDSFYVQIQDKKLSTQTLVERFLEQKKGAKINAFTLSTHPEESYIINIVSKESRKGENYFINPYTGEILPAVTSHDFFKFVENIHRRLLLGEAGKQITGASVLILIVLLISGVYMYMPKIKRGFVKALKINPKAKGRSFLYTLHGTIGLWIVPIYLSISLTGLYWSYHWYNDLLHTLTGVENHKHDSKKKQMGQKQEKKVAENQAQNIAEAFDVFHIYVEKCYSKVMLRAPKSGGDTYTFFYLDKKPAHIYARNTVELKSKTQELIKHELYDEKSMPQKFMASIFALHSGEYFGWVGQLIFFLAALSMPLFGITGLMLYLKKKKAKYAH